MIGDVSAKDPRVIVYVPVLGGSGSFPNSLEKIDIQLDSGLMLVGGIGGRRDVQTEELHR